jgi:hypothetical protein
MGRLCLAVSCLLSPAGSSGKCFSAAAESAKGAQRADVCGPVGDYREPVSAILQDNFVATVKCATSALPKHTTTTAGQNADVCRLPGDYVVHGNPEYRKPAGIIQQYRATGRLSYKGIQRKYIAMHRYSTDRLIKAKLKVTVTGVWVCHAY